MKEIGVWMGDGTRVAGDERFSLEIAGMQGVNGAERFIVGSPRV